MFKRSFGVDHNADRPQSEARGHEKTAETTAWKTRACENGPQHRLGPRYGSRWARSNSSGFPRALSHQIGQNRPMVVQRGYPCQATRR
jgi:hypothetical protein